MSDPLPYLTRDIPGIGGIIKQRPEDFVVQEIPLYEPAGQGEHVYCEIQKISMTTLDAVNRIAGALGLPARDIGYAGMKDARAVTRQVLSVRGADPAAVSNLQLPGITVLWVDRHENKLRPGHLQGNRFVIKVREVEPTAVVKLPPMIEILTRRGMPNYFGEQRFGRRGDNDLLGAAMVREDNEAALKLFLGTPNPRIDDRATLEARTAFDERDNERSMRAWPRRCGIERRVLARLMKSHRPGAALRMIDERLTRLWISALQSRVFNAVVARRIDQLDEIWDGDLAYKHENGACFMVTDVVAEQSRCDNFDISPTGPLVGYRMSFPGGKELDIENAALADVNLSADEFRKSGRLRVKGARRPMRVQPSGVEFAAGVDEHGAHVTVAFTLPAGSYATVFLRELTKSDFASEDQDISSAKGNSEPAEAGPEIGE